MIDTEGIGKWLVVDRTIGMTLDCVDVRVAAIFWKAALGYDEPVRFTDDAQFHALVSPDGGLHHLTLQRVSEPKAARTGLTSASSLTTSKR